MAKTRWESGSKTSKVRTKAEFLADPFEAQQEAARLVKKHEQAITVKEKINTQRMALMRAREAERQSKKASLDPNTRQEWQLAAEQLDYAQSAMIVSEASKVRGEPGGMVERFLIVKRAESSKTSFIKFLKGDEAFKLTPEAAKFLNDEIELEILDQGYDFADDVQRDYHDKTVDIGDSLDAYNDAIARLRFIRSKGEMEWEKKQAAEKLKEMQKEKRMILKIMESNISFFGA